MNCDICGRHHHPQRLPFLCPVDARNLLYESRLAHAAALIQNEQLEKQVNEVLRAADAPAEQAEPAENPTTQDPTTRERHPADRTRIDAWEQERQAILDRTSDVVARASQLRAEMEAARQALERRRQTLQDRRSDLAAASNGTAARRVRLQNEVERSIGMTRFKWNRSYEAMAATRGFLCMEAAKLYGLRRVRRGGGGGGGGSSSNAASARYEIGGLEIVDPYAMNNLPPEVIATSLTHVTHILMLACHYLSIRLPAEVTLPHRDYPRPTIFSLSSSYAHGEVPFPGTANLHPASSQAAAAAAAASAAANGHDAFHRVPRPRPLFVDKPLAALAKDDGATHTMFVEGVALLAYDVAWACCSQGVPLGSSSGSSGNGDRASFDDVFNIGRNLYNLLIGNQLLNNPAGRIFSAAQASSVTTTTTTTTTTTPTANGNASGPGDDLGKAASMMGRHAHGTSHTFLSDDIIQGFKLPSPNRLADRLKTRLSSESVLPDWEVLDDAAWAGHDQKGGYNGGGGGGDVDDEDHHNLEDGVLSKGRIVRRGYNGNNNSGSDAPALPARRLFGVESVATVMTSLEDTLTEADRETIEASRPSSRVPARASGSEKLRAAGTSGWTKLRNRS